VNDVNGRVVVGLVDENWKIVMRQGDILDGGSFATGSVSSFSGCCPFWWRREVNNWRLFSCVDDGASVLDCRLSGRGSIAGLVGKGEADSGEEG
jgi:hypothetical protein